MEGSQQEIHGENEMTDQVKPATRADVEVMKGWPNNLLAPTRIDTLLATLKSWEPVMKDLAKDGCAYAELHKGSIPLSCRARKLMEQWNG